ncbi:MAG: hypothetical protein GWP08_18625 [Nitrospiraceae bacterium]|nr:hypothetical protein [Nitrospiraceae bacterium]
MIPDIWLAFGTQVARLLNNLLESEPIELRRARAVAWFDISKPLWWWMVPDANKKQIEKLIGAINGDGVKSL